MDGMGCPYLTDRRMCPHATTRLGDETPCPNLDMDCQRVVELEEVYSTAAAYRRAMMEYKAHRRSETVTKMSKAKNKFLQTLKRVMDNEES